MPVPPYVAGSVLTAAQLNTGSWKVAEATISGTATTITVSDCFTSTWRHYRIYISGYSATAGLLAMQMTLAGAAATTGYYWNQITRNYNAANSETNSGGTTSSIEIGYLNNGTSNAVSTLVIDVTNPQKAAPTGVFSMNQYNTTSARSVFATHSTATAYDGFKLGSSYNLTLNISVYGLLGAA